MRWMTSLLTVFGGATILLALLLGGCQSNSKSPTSSGNVVVIDNPYYIEDAPLDPTHPNENFGAHDGGRAACRETVGDNDVFLTRLVHLEEEVPPGSVIQSCSLFVYCYRGDSLTGDKTVGVHEVFKPWVEGVGIVDYIPAPGEGCTFNKWDGANDWGTAGCQREDDNGVPNSADGGGDADCTETPMDEVVFKSLPDYPFLKAGYYGFAIDKSLAQQWLDDGECRGLVLKTTEINSWVHFGTKEAPSGQRPYYVIEYTPP